MIFPIFYCVKYLFFFWAYWDMQPLLFPLPRMLFLKFRLLRILTALTCLFFSPLLSMESSPPLPVEKISETSQQEQEESVANYRKMIKEKACLTDIIPIWIAIADTYQKAGQFDESFKELNAMHTLLPDHEEIKQKMFDLLVERGRDEAKKGESQSAVNDFKLALEIENKYRLTILREYADQLTLALQAYMAIPLYLEFLDSHPPQEEQEKALLGLAHAYIWRENYPEALKTYQRILEIDPHYDSYDFFLALARGAASHQKPELASEYYEKAIISRPSMKDSLLREYAKQLSYAFLADRAIPLYKEQLNKEISEEEKRLIRLDLAQAYVWIKNFPPALVEYELLLTQNPQDCEAKNGLADLFISFARSDAENNKHSSAQNWYLNAMALAPSKRGGLLREYADEVSKSGQGPEAIVLYKDILAYCPSLEEARLAKLGLARTYVWVNNHEEALNLYQELLKINPNDVEAKKGEGQVYVNYARYDASKGNRNQAINWFRKAIEADPSQKSFFLKELADQLLLDSQFDEAIALYTELLSPEYHLDDANSIRLKLAETYTKKLQYEDALKEYNNLLEKNKYDGFAKQGKAQVYVDLGNNSAKLNKRAEAIDWYLKALEDDPIRKPELEWKIKEQGGRISEIDECHYIPTIPLSIRRVTDEAATPEIIVQPSQDNPVQAPEKPVQASAEQAASKHLTIPQSSPVSAKPEEITEKISEKIPEEITEKTPEKLSVQEKQKTDTTLENKNQAEQSYHDAIECAKRLEVFEANHAFEISIWLDPSNRGYRESYAWHLRAFSLIEDSIPQFHILLPGAKDPSNFYDALGWDYYQLGQTDASLWAFSHIYRIPCCYTLKNKYVLISALYRKKEYENIDALLDSSTCSIGSDLLEIKKKLFEIYTYIGELKEAAALAEEILYFYPDEYMVHYRYAKLLYEKRDYKEALYQLELLLDKLPENAFLLYFLGKVYEDMGSLEDAYSSYSHALSLHQHAVIEGANARILSKLHMCCEAEWLSEQMGCDACRPLNSSLTNAEVQLNCGNAEGASDLYRDILIDYPYNREALWGLLKSSSYTGNSNDALISYKRWHIVGFEHPYQNQLASYYRPREAVFSAEYYGDSATFSRTSIGGSYNQYFCSNSRINYGYQHTRFSKRHFHAINRYTGFLAYEKFFNERWEGRAQLVENYYNFLQNPEADSNLCNQHYSKGVLNYRLHLTSHPIPELTIDVGHDYYDVIDTVPPFNNPMFNYSDQIGAVTLNTRTRDWNAFLYYSKEKLFLQANFIYGKYSDDNLKRSRSFRGDYKICELPETKIFYSYFYLDFKNPAPLFSQCGLAESAYYDPTNLEIHSLGFDVDCDINERLKVGGEAAAHRLPKSHSFAGSAFCHVLYEFTKTCSLRLDLRYYYQAKSVLRSGIGGFHRAQSGNVQLIYNF